MNSFSEQEGRDPLFKDLPDVIQPRISFGDTTRSPTMYSTYPENRTQRDSSPNHESEARKRPSYSQSHLLLPTQPMTTQSQSQSLTSCDYEFRRQLQLQLTSKMKRIEEMLLRERQLKTTIHELQMQLDERNDKDYYRDNDQEESSKLSNEVTRLKKEILSKEYQLRMMEGDVTDLKQNDSSARLRQQLKIKQQYYQKNIKELEWEREVQVDRLVRLFEDYILDMEKHYLSIIEDNNVRVSENIQDSLYSMRKTFTRNKEREINRIGMEYIGVESTDVLRVRSKTKHLERVDTGEEDNTVEVVRKLKEQFMALNRLKEKEIEEIRNVRDKYSYLDIETEYQKVYLGLIVELQSLRYKKILGKSSLETTGEVFQMQNEIKFLNQEIRRLREGDDGLKLRKELQMLKEYIKEENESKIKFFGELQTSRNNNRQIYEENSKLKRELDSVSQLGLTKNGGNIRNTNEYKVLEMECKQLREEILSKNIRLIDLQRETKINGKHRPPQINPSEQQLTNQLQFKQASNLKLISDMQNCSQQVQKLEVEKSELLELIKKLGANIEKQSELKIMLRDVEKENIELKTELQILRESLSQGNITKAANEACRLISERYDKDIINLQALLDRGRQEIIGLQKVNGQLMHDLRTANQQSKTKGMAVQHLWEVKNAEYENIVNQIKRLQSL